MLSITKCCNDAGNLLSPAIMSLYYLGSGRDMRSNGNNLVTYQTCRCSGSCTRVECSIRVYCLFSTFYNCQPLPIVLALCTVLLATYYGGITVIKYQYHTNDTS